LFPGGAHVFAGHEVQRAVPSQREGSEWRGDPVSHGLLRPGAHQDHGSCSRSAFYKRRAPLALRHRSIRRLHNPTEGKVQTALPTLKGTNGWQAEIFIYRFLTMAMAVLGIFIDFANDKREVK